MMYIHFVLAFALAASASAQSVTVNYIESVAGNTVFDRRPPLETPLIAPQSVWVNPSNGDVWISDGNFVVRRVRGNATAILAGGGALVDDGLGIDGRTARFDFPSGITGNDTDVFVADVRHNRVRRINANGQVQTIVGTGAKGFSGDGGRGSAAQLTAPRALALSSSGDLYIGDAANYRIRKYNLRTQIITTIAGTGEYGFSGDGGRATEARIGSVRGLAVDSTGTVYLTQRVELADGSVDVRVRKIRSDGIIERIAGAGPQGYTGDGGPALNARLGSASGIAVDVQGNIYIADLNYHRIRIITGGTISSYAGKDAPANPGVEDVPATSASLKGPAGIWVTPTGDLYIADSDNDVIRKVDGRSKRITTVAGTANPFDGPGLGPTAPLARPSSVAADSAGNLYVADTGHYRVRRIDGNGAISTVAGDGKAAGSLGATANSLGATFTISIDPQDRLLIADRYRGLVRRVNPQTGAMTTVVDLRQYDSQPTYAIGDAIGNIYVSDYRHDIVWVANGSEVLRLAGTGKAGDFGDYGIAPEAQLDSPEGLLLDGDGNLLICDSGNHRVRIVDLSTLIIEPFAGDGNENTDFDGYDATLASLETPVALAKDSDGNIYIADEAAQRIRYVYASDGKIATLTGSEPGFAGDGGPSSLARFDRPSGLVLSRNSLYVCDQDNYRIRRIFTREIPIELIVSPRQMTFRAPQGGDLPSAQLLVIDSSLLGYDLPYSIGGGTDSGGGWLTAGWLEGFTPDVNYVVPEYKSLDPGTYTGKIVVSAPPAGDVTIPIELVVDPPNEVSSVTLSTDYVALTSPLGASTTHALQIRSLGRPLEWSWRPLISSPWLRFSEQAGVTPSIVTLAASAAEPGTYFAAGYFTTSLGGSTLFVFSLTVTEPRPVLTLDRSSVVVETIEGATNPPPQTIEIFNQGSAPLAWRIEIPASSPWLRATPSSGSLAPNARPQAVRLTIDPAGLSEGVYQADAQVRADSGAIGSPRALGVRLKIEKAGVSARAKLDRSALIFNGPPGVELPSQTVVLSATGALVFNATVRTAAGGKWLSVSPAAGGLIGSSDRVELKFGARTDSLTDGVYRGTVALGFTDGSVQEVDVQLIVRGGAAVSAGIDRRTRRDAPARGPSAACQPARQVVAMSALGNNFSSSTGWPVPIRVQVFDDCGVAATANTVSVSFSNGDSEQVLKSLRNGDYTAMWTPSKPAASAVLTIRSVHPSLAAIEFKTTGRVVASDAPPPVLFSGGIVNAASRRASSLIAPESLVVLRGANFPATAAEVQVIMAGRRATVVDSTPEEIRALVPVEMTDQTEVSVIVVARGLTTSPEIVTIVPVDPGLFPLAEGATAVRGEMLEMLATGLGPADGEGKVTTPLTATLGEAAIEVESAVRAEQPGVYKIRLRIPAEGAPGKLAVSQRGIVSNPVDVPF